MKEFSTLILNFNKLKHHKLRVYELKKNLYLDFVSSKYVENHIDQKNSIKICYNLNLYNS